MAYPVRIALVGDHDPQVTAHRAIPDALALAGRVLSVTVTPHWVPTDVIDPHDPAAALAGAHGVWCVPASPYRREAGALAAIRHARTAPLPFLGSCGGFQHAALEYARDVLGWADAAHAETTPEAERAVVAPLACSLVEVRDVVHFTPGSRLAKAYGSADAREGYHCNFGLNPAFAVALTAGPLRATAVDDAGDVRAVELDGHPFFVATLIQSERRALAGEPPPIVCAFVQAAVVAGRRAPAGAA